MAKTTADVLFERLIDWGVDAIFGLPGDGINGFIEALRTHQDRIRFVQVRHEEGAAFAACGYAKFSGRLGVCIATSGPGAIHLLNGLYDAKMDGAPVLAITGQTYHDLMGMHYQQEVNLLNSVRGRHRLQPAGQRAAARRVPWSTPPAARRWRSRGVAHINCCNDWQEKSTSDGAASADERQGTYVQGVDPAHRRPAGRVAEEGRGAAQRRARRLSSSPARGRWGPGTSSSGSPTRWRRRSSRPCWARPWSPTTLPTPPAASGCWAPSPPRRRWRSATPCSLPGSSFPYMQYLPEPDQAKAVQIDRDPTRLGLRYPIDVGLTGDAKATLQALLPLLQRRQDRSFLETAQRADEGMVGADAQPRGSATTSRSSRRSLPSTSTTCSPTTPSSRPIRARSRRGRHGT